MLDATAGKPFLARAARPFLRSALVLTLAGSAACAAGPIDAQSSHGRPSQDIVETAVAADDFNTLVAAVQAAGLVETLQGDGPFTVFAPTDEAFAALPEGTVESLLLPENRDALVSILTYHVVAGRVTAEQVVQLDEAETVNGAEVGIRTRGNTVFVNDSRVLTTDVFASNGVIHIIDQVLLPPELMSAAEGQSESRGRMTPMSTPDERGQEAREILRLALQRGVPLFNRGDVDATAYIYEVAMSSIVAGNFDLPRGVEGTLERGLERGGRIHDERDRAWAYRDAIDIALENLAPVRMTAARHH